jgi:hypothetical protein
MLRRQGIQCFTTARPKNDRTGLHAHVWVRDGDVDVIAGEVADRFALLTTFPHEARSLSETISGNTFPR